MPVLGLLLLILVHLLPTNPMKQHVADSYEVISRESNSASEVIIPGFNATLTGNFTDSLMLQNAIYNNPAHNAFEQALKVYRHEIGDANYWLPFDSLTDYLNTGDTSSEVNYQRYWHGYLVFLKPLLLVTSLNSLRLFSAALQLILVGLCIMLLSKKGHTGLALSFMASLPFMFFFTSFASLSLSICLYIMLAGIMMYLLFEKYVSKNLLIYFLILGMVTSYFDFLTYPLVTLCFPLCIVLALNIKDTKKSLLDMLIYSAEWAVGFVWMWGSKWVIGFIFGGKDALSDALSTVAQRTGNTDGFNKLTGLFNTLKLNLSPFMNWGFVLTLVIIVGIIIAYFISNKNKQTKLQNIVPFICLSLYPLVWFFLTENHSSEHWMFTCRILSVSVFALLSGVIAIRKE